MKQLLLKALHFSGFKPKFIGPEELASIELLIDTMDDFFFLCEGERGTALGIFNASPPNINKKDCKILIGIYDHDRAIALIDLIKDYPNLSTVTIGYLLVHPHYRGKKIASQIVSVLYQVAWNCGVKNLRCIVQEQNPLAKEFWQRNFFNPTEKIQQSLGEKESTSYILERKVI